MQDSGSVVLGLQCRGPEPVGMQTTAGPCLWGLRVPVKVVRQVAMSPPSTVDRSARKQHPHLPPLLEMSQLHATQLRPWCKLGLPGHGTFRAM